MKFKVWIYLTFYVLAFTLIAFWESYELGLIFFLFFSFTLIGKRLVESFSTYYTNIFIIIVFSVFIVYFVRPVLLYINPSLYYYKKQITIINQTQIISNMWGILASTFCLFTGFILSLNFFKPEKRDLKLETNLDIIKNANYIIFLSLILSSIRFILNVILGIGIKGHAISSSVAFLSRFAPEHFLIGLLLFLFTFLYPHLSKPQKMLLIISLVLLSTALVATGSKALFLLIFFYYFIYYLLYQKKLSVVKVLIMSAVVLLLVPFSFSMGNAVKIAAFKNELNFSTIYDYTLKEYMHGSWIDTYGNITNRFIGLDGEIAKNSIHADKLFDVFSLYNTLLRSTSMIIPGVDFGLESTGVAVSKEVLGFKTINAGALGGYAALELILSNVSFIGAFLFGLLIAYIAKLLRRDKSEFLIFNKNFLFGFFILNAIMSGNFDYCIALFIISLILNEFYFHYFLKKTTHK
jgi:hypothetical protein